MIARAAVPLALLLLALMPALVRSQVQDNPPTTDLKPLEGTWKVIAAEEGGRRLDQSMLVDQSLTFSVDGKYSVESQAETFESGTFTLDPKATPFAIDLKILQGPDSGKSQLGIYRIEDGRLSLSFNRPGNPTRPERFETKAGSAQFTLRLERRPPSP